MELLEEYQQALYKIRDLETKIKDYKEVIDTVQSGLDVVINSLKTDMEGIEASNSKEEAILNSIFNRPMQLLSVLKIMLDTPNLSKEEQRKNKEKVIELVLDMMKDNLRDMELVNKN